MKLYKIMAKETILKEKGTGEVMYPRTMASLVRTASGHNVDEALEIAKFRVFVDEWNARCVVCSAIHPNQIKQNTFGRYNEETGFFELNGLTDITYEEAVEIMRVPDTMCSHDVANRNYQYSRARTFFPIKGDIQAHRGALFMQVPNLEVVRLVNYYIVNNGADPDTSPQLVSHTRNMFFLCPRLREVKGVIKLMSTDDMNVHFYDTFGPVLETLWVQGICLPVQLHRCPKLRLECIAYMVEYAANTTEIEIMLHPDVFALLPDELIAKAAEKSISFVARA